MIRQAKLAEWLEMLDVFSQKKKLQKVTTVVFKCLEGFQEDNEAVVPEDQSRKRFKLQENRFRSDIWRKILMVKFFTTMVQIALEMVAFPLLKVFKQRLDSHLSEMLQCWVLLAQNVE